jgi:hypothetical protein
MIGRGNSLSSKSGFRFRFNFFREFAKKLIPALRHARKFSTPFPFEGALMRRLDCGKWPAPAGAVRSRITGRLRVTVRGYYGPLPSMAGMETGRIRRNAYAEGFRSTVLKTERRRKRSAARRYAPCPTGSGRRKRGVPRRFATLDSPRLHPPARLKIQARHSGRATGPARVRGHDEMQQYC